MFYLVGDVIDNWSLKKIWFWNQSHNDVIQEILRKARKSTRVIYIPGNHDERSRNFVGTRFGRVAVMQNAIHITADMKRYLVPHGDEFDGVICGHINTPEISMIDGIHYCNDGDWIESCSALVEHADGRFKLIQWTDQGLIVQETRPDHAHQHRDRRLAPAG